MRILAAILTFFVFSAAFAGDNLSGYAGMSGIYFSSGNRLMVSGDNNFYNDKTEELKLIVSGELKYKYSDSITYHIGVPQNGQEPVIKAGITAGSGFSKLDVSAFYKPSEVWQNPYTQYRTKTDEKTGGISARLDGIAESPLFAELKYTFHSPDKDTAGELFPQLKREGAETEYTIGYTVKKRLEVYAKYINDKRDGSAESSGSFAQGIILKMPTESKNLFLTGAEAMTTRFNSTNPYFNAEREDASMRVFASYTFNNFFGTNRYLSLSGFYIRNVSNIDFFDYKTSGGIVSAGVRF